jgi:phage repressor protein C with HTH and peptisase S24 domain
MDASGGAGPGVINSDYPEVLREVEIAEWQVRQELGRVPSPSRVKLLTVRGESMAPRIRSGDVVFVDIEDQSPYDGGLFVIVLHGHALVKRIEIRTDGLHIVSLATPTRPDIVPPDRMDSLHIAGRVLGAIQLRKAEDLQ